MRYVLDCSVALKWFLPEADSGLARAALDASRAGRLSLVAPEILVPEFGHALRKHALGRRIAAAEALAALEDFRHALPDLVPNLDLATEALRLALAHHASFYDALYMSLAVRDDLKVLTAAEGLANAFAPLDRTMLLRDAAL